MSPRCVFGVHDWRPTGRFIRWQFGRGWWGVRGVRRVDQCGRCSRLRHTKA